ncbi:DNA-3-methyladenine glycosylase 2 family protein [uncultured Lentibacter sp.]|uniref:DNA-3-methyladenine glycosylase family protein n=1 Tax=uncultured Lentibacter sp. TaxID=1659309 RepID=UPI00260A8D97|nr:DNA-3-methyladenine glycosylase 2 family protein [uncultured Lentibacter sp.]
MDERVILGAECLAEGMVWLSERDVKMAEAYALTGPLPLRLKPDGFGALLSAIVSQQVSVASARAIWDRLGEAGCGRPEAVDRLSEDALRALGLSRQKAAYAKALAGARIDYEALRALPSADVIRILTAVKGIGLWTAEIYAMFSLGRADVFAHGDLALQEAARVLYGLKARPGAAEMRAMAAHWAPWRAVAARLLWAYYKEIKDREGSL